MGEEFVAARGELGLGPPAVFGEAGFRWQCGGAAVGCGVGGVGEVDAFAAVVVVSAAVEAGFAVPEVGSDVVDEDPGFFGEFAAGGLGQGFIGSAPPSPGSSHRWWVELVGVEGVDE